MTFGEKNVDKPIRSTAVEKKEKGTRTRDKISLRHRKTPDRIFLSGVALIVTQNRHSGGQGE